MSKAHVDVRRLRVSVIRIAMPVFLPLFAGLLVLGTACTDSSKAPVNAQEGAVARDAEGVGAPTPRPAPQPPACQMVSVEVLKETTGVEGEGKPSKSGGADVCTWMGEGGKSVVLQLYPSASRYEQAREVFEEMQGQKSEELSGVGDKAFFVGGKMSSIDIGTVTAQKGQTALSVQVMSSGASAATLKEESTALAKKVIASL